MCFHFILVSKSLKLRQHNETAKWTHFLLYSKALTLDSSLICINEIIHHMVKFYMYCNVSAFWCLFLHRVSIQSFSSVQFSVLLSLLAKALLLVLPLSLRSSGVTCNQQTDGVARHINKPVSGAQKTPRGHLNSNERFLCHKHSVLKVNIPAWQKKKTLTSVALWTEWIWIRHLTPRSPSSGYKTLQQISGSDQTAYFSPLF